MSYRRPALSTVAALSACALVLAGCSRDEAGAGGGQGEAFAEPVTITNCDREATFDGPPQRIITMNGHVTETLIQMGVGDRIIGKAYAEREPLPELAEQFEAIPTLAEQYPTWEQVRDLEPDLVVGGMSSAFSEDDRLGRDTLEDDGIATFLFSEYCGDGFSDISLLEEDFAQLGQILDAEDAADELTDSIVDGLDEIRAAIDESGAADVPTFFYDGGESEPLTISSVGIGNLIAEYAGAENITPEGERPYVTSSWEVVGERAPEAIVVLDYGETSAADKIEFLKAHPIASTTPAVRDEKFIVVPLSDFFESSRMVTSVETISQALHPDVVES